MRFSADTYLSQVNIGKAVKNGFRSIGWALSAVVILVVFWGLKLTGITMAGEAFCGMEEHVHTEDCRFPELICTLEETPGHVHGEECVKLTLHCTKGHTHDDGCYGDVLICTVEEGEDHTHGEECYGRELICTLPEETVHTHGDGCYDDVLTCTLEENEDHTHSEACYVQELTCTLPEEEPHTHGDDCYTREVICQLEETQGHTHGDACYQGEDVCTLEEHIHTPNCYSDHNADLETDDDWEGSLHGMIRSPSTYENVLMVARSQLGMAESTRNFQVDAVGVRRGITRYGQWYGNPYADWSAMFVSFCLEYAGVQEVPLSAGPETMRVEWDQLGIYAPAADYVPEAGQLLFLDKDGNGAADAVAIITNQEENVLFVIEGDLREPVTEIGSVKLSPEDGETEESAAQLLTEGEEAVPQLLTEGEETQSEVSSEEEETSSEIPAEEESDEEVPAADTVAETLYSVEDPAVMGYGLVPPEPGHLILAPGDARIVWLDGTNGGIMGLGGSPNERWAVREGQVITLPETWQSPDKYNYHLKGWYDVTNNQYYAPGAEVTVTGNMVFYADWVAGTYDIGQFNSQVANTVSTNDFVTVRMFDYGVLFNVLSERPAVTVNNNSHTETWSLLTSGNNPYNGEPTLNFIMRDWDRGSEDISYPSGTNDRNNPTDAGTVYPGLYTNTIRNLLFDPGTQVIGKQYLGTGDHLFQLCEDPTHDHYGYYYYNSERNAASYNQSAQRFYVYEYLESTQDAAKSEGDGRYSGFLPLNSPYANTNGKQVKTYTFAGVYGDHNGNTHYMYDSKYSDSNNSTNNVGTNFWYGMSVDIDFYLPNTPGTQVTGGYGNQDLYGRDMHFRFTGDDDVWVLIDGVMVLDLGGIHGMESGDINFSTGVVTVNGVVNQQLSNNLKSIGAGEHTLSLYYLERGASMSNCSIYFNLAPRFSFNIQKEDVLTRDVLNGAQFSVYMDQACTVPAQLWTSKASHDRNDPSTNVFTVANGTAHMWGMGAGNTYYIKETKPPDNPDYEGLPNGIIRLVFDKSGTASYNVDVIDTGSGVSGGFTVHGFRIDTETQQAYIIATNAPKWAKEVTTVQVRKQWDDQLNHNADAVTVYLTVTDQDGTVRRLREVQLSSGNDWNYQWENLPKYWEDGSLIQYGVEEAYIPGYYNKVEKVDRYTTTVTTWQDTTALEPGKTYILRTSSGYLSTSRQAEDTGFMWVDEETAKSSPLARWYLTASGNTYRFTNEAGQMITFYYGNGSPTDYFAYTQQKQSSDSNYKQFLSYSTSGGSIRIYFDRPNSSTNYYLSSMMSNGKFQYNTNSRNAILFTPSTEVQTTTTVESTAEVAYQVTNTPLAQETSVTVQKNWDYGQLNASNLHEQFQVTVKLLADGKDTGRTVTLTLKNGWKDTFRGLPYADESGRVITYSVVEIWENPEWITRYGEIVTTGGSPPTYSTTITNGYIHGVGGPQLPSTGTAARLLYILCGGGIMLTSLVYGIISRRKRERRVI